MPTYDYVCETCAHEWSEDQRITDPPRKSCPRAACAAETAKRLISGGGSFILAGGGWGLSGYGNGR